MTPMTDIQVRNKGFRILLQELGSIDMIRFLSQIPLTPVEFHADLRKNRHWVQLDGELAKQRLLAHRQHISTRSLVNSLLKERLQRA